MPAAWLPTLAAAVSPTESVVFTAMIPTIALEDVQETLYPKI